jgi:hypothetical protein
VGEVPAYPVPRDVDVHRRRRGGRAAVLERQVPVDVIADRLDPLVAGRKAAEALPRLGRQQVGQAVAARQGVDQRVIRQLIRGHLGRVGIGGLGRIGHIRQRREAELRPAGGQHGARAVVAVEVDVPVHLGGRIAEPPVALGAEHAGDRRAHHEYGRGGNLRHVGEHASDAEPPSSRHLPIVLVPCFPEITRDT